MRAENTCLGYGSASPYPIEDMVCDTSGVELEGKLAVRNIPRRTVTATLMLRDIFSSPLLKESQYHYLLDIANPTLMRKQGPWQTHHFFGQMAEQHAVVIESGALWNKVRVKEKHGLSLSLPHRCEAPHVFVHKREEHEREATLQEAFGRLQELGTHYQGTLRKEQYPQRVVDGIDGKVYEVCASRCVSGGRELRQIEAEYLGRLPQFPDTGEEGIVNGILALMHTLILAGRKQGYALAPTLTRKYDFARGKEQVRCAHDDIERIAEIARERLERGQE